MNYNVRVAASDALVVVLDEYPDTLQAITIFYQLLSDSFKYVIYVLIQIDVCAGISCDFILSLYP